MYQNSTLVKLYAKCKALGRCYVTKKQTSPQVFSCEYGAMFQLWKASCLANIYRFQFNNNTTKRCEIGSGLTVKTPERGLYTYRKRQKTKGVQGVYRRRFSVFIVNSKHSSLFFSVCIVDFEQVNVYWVSVAATLLLFWRTSKSFVICLFSLNKKNLFGN